MEALVAQDTGVVDHHIDPTEGIQGVLHDLVAIGHRIVIGHRNATGSTDFGNHSIGGRSVGALALSRTTQVIDHDPGAMAGEQQGMGTPQAAAGARDDHDFIFEAH
ncbi:hypothetical protein D9M72_566410 [compost metagenome]